MTMLTTEEHWRELEAEPSQAGWLFRLARPLKGHPLYVALDGATGRRALLLRVPAEVIPPRRLWPVCRGLLFFAETIGGHPHCGVALKEARFADVFTALAEDLARRVSDANSAGEATETLLGQLARWQKFLAATSDGLGDEAQRGLWGELHCLHEWLIPKLGVGMAIAGWKGGERAQQDFQFAAGALEVKTTIAKQPQTIRITSERQLDDTSWPALFLHVTVLALHEGTSDSLPALVETLRTLLAVQSATREQFEDSLLEAGYFDVHAPYYAARGYSVRATHWFSVRENFPRIIEATLPQGVGDIHYVLSLAACEPFATDSDAVLGALANTPVSESHKKS
jgi:Putative  PD-(D/E)XK family member, (DUF4420)